ncbi:YgjV family protein [Thioalkalivibrio thiocyanodenitrificans]|uniref:YgjV family protein n=1 Tax=Thioalkalivibrio thiocyanodenitrificans TaxID=243063 RepID=UPI000366781B|nr:YgjV family protein [Thioalkalivibrio thiocyanodenitrificans]
MLEALHAMTTPALLAGLLAATLQIVAFSQRSRAAILFIYGLAIFAWAAHFFLLGAIASSVIVALSALRTWLFIRYPSTMLAMAFIVGTVLVFLISPSLLTALAGAGTVLIILSNLAGSTERLRLYLFGGIFLILTHDLLAGSPVAAAADLLSLLSIAYGAWRSRASAKTTALGPRCPKAAR